MVETDSAIKLLQELKVNKLLPKFNDSGINEVQSEISKIFVQLTAKLSQDTCQLDVGILNLTLKTIQMLGLYSFSRRSCKEISDVDWLICKSTRLDRLQRVAWESGKALPKHVEDNLSASEIQYYKQYLQSLDEISKEYSQNTNGLDLTVDLTPPKDLFIEVRIKKDYGAVMLPESGEVHLQKNTTHLLRRSEVDHLIKQGIITEVI